MQLTEKHKQYWQKNLRLTAILLVIWFFATFVIVWFARDLQSITFLGFPLQFYMGAQGSLIIYVAIIWYYAHAMNKLDLEYGVHEGDE
jgi:putative solute:sodium symporter small subunit